jgi:uncharacterized damage-inducible protein DinB
MKPFFNELFEYSHYFNRKLGDVFIYNADRVSERAIKLYSHILNAHQIWNNRINPKQAHFGVWEIHSIQDCKQIDSENFENSLVLLDRFDLNEAIHYTNTRGEAFTNDVKSLFFHIINHSTYHRGQLATELKQNGLDPLVTDYIIYKR